MRDHDTVSLRDFVEAKFEAVIDRIDESDKRSSREHAEVRGALVDVRKDVGGLSERVKTLEVTKRVVMAALTFLVTVGLLATAVVQAAS